MTTAPAPIQLPNPPNRAGQATQIEQSRAVAEVQGAIIVAQQCPRSIDRALDALERSCKEMELARRAFYRYDRGGKQVTGPTIQLAQELARCWQNMQSGLIELSRDDTARRSEMMAFAWDLEMNTRRTTTFISPHRTYTGGEKQLDAMRDVYENNASSGARREREMILSVLPAWFVKKGEALCRDTITRDAGDKPIEERRRNAVTRFEELGVRRNQLVAKLGAPVDSWINDDLTTLTVIYEGLKSGEVSKDVEFPPTTAITAQDITGAPVPTEPPVGVASTRQLTAIAAWFTEHGLSADRVSYVAALIGRPITSTNEVTGAEASTVLDQLAVYAQEDDPVTALQEVAAEFERHTPPAGDGGGP